VIAFEWKALPRFDVSLLVPAMRMRCWASTVSAQMQQRLKTKLEGKVEKLNTRVFYRC
jgi:hypothetical protein